MTQRLVKWFVKDYEKTEDINVRVSYGVLASMVGICCNLLLFMVKLFLGILVHSISVMADAFNNLSDAGSSIITLIRFLDYRIHRGKDGPEAGRRRSPVWSWAD